MARGTVVAIDSVSVPCRRVYKVGVFTKIKLTSQGD